MLTRFIMAINSLSTPWIAILVISLGMTFDIFCKNQGINSDAAVGVIGAGIGLLTAHPKKPDEKPDETST
jgi:hypothetical protein